MGDGATTGHKDEGFSKNGMPLHPHYTLITTKKGPKCQRWVYVVEGHRAEPLLGDKDTYRLGIITFREEGREPT